MLSRRIRRPTQERHIPKRRRHQRNPPLLLLFRHHLRSCLATFLYQRQAKLKALTKPLTHAVQACTQYPAVIPLTKSSSVISTKNMGFEAPAHANTASGASPPCAAHTSSSAAVDAAAVSRECEYPFNNWEGLTRTSCSQSVRWFQAIEGRRTSSWAKALSILPWFRATMETWAPFLVSIVAKESPRPVLPPVM